MTRSTSDFAAARDDDVHVVVHAQELAHGRAVGGVDDEHRVLGQPRRAQTLVHAHRDRQIGVDRLRTAAQDAGVARLQAERRGIRSDVRARLVDDSDHAERHAHPADLDPGRPLRELGDRAHRIGQRRDLLQAFRHRLDRLVGQREPVDHRRLEACGTRRRDVPRIGGENLRPLASHRRGHRAQRAVLGPGVGLRDHARRGARAPAEVLHVRLDVHAASLAYGSARTFPMRTAGPAAATRPRGRPSRDP